MTIVGFSVPLTKRPMYIAAISSMFGISSVVGPLLGGALTDKASWRWSVLFLTFLGLNEKLILERCFWINLPFGAVYVFHKPKHSFNTD